jgi:uncharacterized protein (TIGR03086 family)
VDPVDALERSWTASTTLVAAVSPEQLGRATACVGWDVKALLNHTLGECQMMTLVNAGEDASNERGDFVGEGHELADTWARVGEENVASWRASGLEGDRTYFYGTFPGAASAVINLGEVLVHSWDLARGIGVEFAIDPELATMVHGLYAAVPLDGMRAGGMLAPEVPVEPDAPIADRMLGLLGRQP